MTTLPRLAALTLLAGLVAACSPGDGSGGGSVAAAGRAGAAPLTVEQLSAKVGCTPKMQVNVRDIRTGYCRTPDGEFYVTTFRTASGKARWMEAAPGREPRLVGDLWAVLSSRNVLDLLKERLGGDVQPAGQRAGKTRAAG
jgi:hypothetical protein